MTKTTLTDTAKKVLHRADTRGGANHGWLKTFHSFSFASWYDPRRMGFGALRVLNDDQVAPSMGFDFHPHSDMEIISIPLEGALRHRDNMGNETVIKSTDVQLMSAGKGVFHEEYNASTDDDVKFLQIWVFPREKGIDFRYDQKTFEAADRVNKWQTLVSPEDDGAVTIMQDAWFSRTTLEAGKELSYTLKGKNTGVYLLMLEGEAEVAGEALVRRDALALWELDHVDLQATADADILLLEVPMEV
ncbi:MAG: pirin family protein [Bacteroidota bacterium]